MPILRVARAMAAQRTCALMGSHGAGDALAYSSDFGLLGEQSSPKWEIPCQ